MGDKETESSIGLSSVGMSLPYFELQASQGILSTEEQGENSIADSHSLKGTDDLSHKKEDPEIDILQFQNSFYECVEELKICRCTDADNEVKINQLVSTQHDDHQALKEAISKNNTLLEKHSQELSELRRQHEEKIHQLEAEKSKLTLASESCTKEMQVLKVDIRTLQLTKYSLEKTIRDQAQRLKMQGSIRSTHLSKMTELEALGKDIEKQCNSVAEQLRKLEVNVKESIELNCRLNFINKHHICISDSLKEDLKKKTEEIVQLRALLYDQPNQEDGDMKAMQSKLTQVEQQVKQKDTVCEQLLEQLEAARTANQRSLEALARSQLLAESHLNSSDMNSELASSLSRTVRSLELKICRLKESISTMEEELSLEKHKQEEFATESHIQEESFKSQLRAQQEENQALIKALENLEELNSSWSDKNINLIETIKELKEQLIEFEKREEEKPKKETKSTNTEVDNHKQTPEAVAKSPDEKESISEALESNSEVNQKQDNNDNTDVHVPQEKAGEGHLSSEDSSCIEINMHIEAETSKQVSGVKGGKEKPVRAGDNQMNTRMGPTMEHAGAEMEYVTVRPTQGRVLEEGGPCENTSKKGLQLPQNEDIPLQPLIPAVAKQVNVSECSEYYSLEMAISEVDVDKPMNKVASEKDVKHILSLGESQKPTNQVDSEKHIGQGESQGAVDQINPEQATNQVVSHKSINLEEAINQVNAEQTINKAAPQEDVNQIGSINKNDNHNVKSVTLLGVRSQTISGMHHNKVKQLGTDSLIQVSLQSSTNPLIQEDVGHDFKNIDGKEFITAPDNSNNVSSKTLTENVQPRTKVNSDDKGKDNYVKNNSNRLPSRMITLGDVGDVECEKSAPQNTDIRCTTGTGLMSSISNPLLAKGSSYSLLSVAKVRVSSSSPSGVDTFTRSGTKSAYVLPGFSLLTQPRQGVAIRADPYLNLPPLPHGIGKTENLSATSETTLLARETSSLRKYKDYNISPEKMPSTKERENSKEWPNFAEEFDSGPNPDQLSFDKSQAAPTCLSPQKGSKRPADDNESSLFSDDDDETDIKSDVASQINRIERFLRSDRLKRSKRNSSVKEQV